MAYRLMGSHCDALVIVFSHNDVLFYPCLKLTINSLKKVVVFFCKVTSNVEYFNLGHSD